MRITANTQKSLGKELRDLIRTKDLIWAWTSRIIRARYEQSLLGGIWAIARPAATVAVFTIIFTQFLQRDTEVPYPIFAYTAMVPWMFFSSSVGDMVPSLTINMTLINQIYFPREVLPISAMLSRLMDFFIAGSLLVVLMIFYSIPVNVVSLLFIPLIILIMMMLALGLGLAGAAINVFYRDVSHLVGLALQLWLYASPIIYPVDMVPAAIRPFYFLNPMAGVLEAFRDVILYERLPGPYLVPAAIISFLVLIIGYILFKRVEPLFADLI